MSKIVTPRCIRCRKPLRKDGTCQNPNCVRYTPEKETSTENNKSEDKEEDEATEGNTAPEPSNKETK